ncbi:uncharacterized protein METZ01_LOCUS461435 [marine metagenome]|uniref:Uncharacterized protein n=1 Tax=marine metagenome TaxID=408172 RepID=A0A383ALZ4_9ZZZZ
MSAANILLEVRRSDTAVERCIGGSRLKRLDKVMLIAVAPSRMQ